MSNINGMDIAVLAVSIGFGIFALGFYFWAKHQERNNQE